MLPISHVFNKFSRLVRDVSSQEKKEIDFIIEGGETELDRTIVDKLSEPLIHLIKNAVDHGIESVEDRVSLGKGKGVVKLYAKRNRNKVLIVLEDDGNGFDIDVIKRVAVEKGIVSKESILKFTDKQLLELPFLPKYSSKKEVTEISGRGVGLDVVKREIELLHGNVILETKKGEGSKFILELPLTLAVVSSFIIKVSDRKYAIPILNIVKSISISSEEIGKIGTEEVIVFEGESISLIRLNKIFNLEEEKKEKLLLLIIERRSEKIALVIDKIIEQKEVILKLLDDELRSIKGIAGATILGDGKPALMLDVVTLVE
jgi:two-component system chemotaxis sensor kinase CheA